MLLSLLAVSVLGAETLSETLSELGAELGAECVGLKDEKGNCVAVSACTTNEWVYGKRTDPVCDTPGPYSENAIVCCFDTPLESELMAIHSKP